MMKPSLPQQMVCRLAIVHYNKWLRACEQKKAGGFTPVCAHFS